MPDVATISTGVITQAADANAAMRANAVQMDKVMAALRGAGIAERDIQTSGISLNPQLPLCREPAADDHRLPSQQHGEREGPRPRQAGQGPRHPGAQGANQINGPSFEVDKPDEAYAEARVSALRKAQAQARTYADALGLQVRRIVSISEGGASLPRPMPMVRAMASDAMMAKDVGRAGRDHAVDRHRSRVRAGALRWAPARPPGRPHPHRPSRAGLQHRLRRTQATQQGEAQIPARNRHRIRKQAGLARSPTRP